MHDAPMVTGDPVDDGYARMDFVWPFEPIEVVSIVPGNDLAVTVA